MNTEQQKKLESLLTAYSHKQEEQKKEAEKEQQQIDLFAQQFEQFGLDVIYPVMEEISSVLKQQGHYGSVSYHRETKSDSAKVRMEIFKNCDGLKNLVSNPSNISFVADKANKKIKVFQRTMHGNSGGSAGFKTNTYTIADLTREKIEEEIVDSIGNIFDNTL